MRNFLAINKRNLGLYFRDYSAVFFSLLSMLIIIVLMVFFLGDINNTDILDALSRIPGRDRASDLAAVKNISFLWTCAGIMTVNASTVTHAFYSNMIKDRGGNRLNSLFVMPVKRPVFVLGYVSAAWTAGVVMSIVTMIVTEIIGVINGVDILPIKTHLELIGLIMLNTFVYSTIMFFLASVIKSQSAWSGIGIILGTLAGFLGGIYFPLGSMSEAMQATVKFFPFIYGTSLFRKVMLNPIESELFGGAPEIIRTEVDKVMGMDLFLGNNQLSEPGKVGILISVGLVFIIVSTFYLTFSKRKDR